MLKISQLYIYPLKSLGGITVNQARVTARCAITTIDQTTAE